jgi:hypothetical protein
VNKNNLIAMFFIAACALSTGVAAKNVYKCGDTYAQTPCPDAVTLEANDARSKAQKTQSENAIKRDTAAANAMEKARLQDEALAAAPHKAAVQGSTKSATKKKKDSKKKEPELFTTAVPVEKKTQTKKDAAAPTQ